MKFSPLIPLVLALAHANGSTTDHNPDIGAGPTATSPVMETLHVDTTSMVLEGGASDKNQLLEMRATSEGSVATAMEALRDKDIGTQIQVLEGVLDDLELMSEEIDAMEPTGQPEMDGLVKNVGSTLGGFFRMAPDVLQFMRSGQQEQAKTELEAPIKEDSNAMASSSVRGKTRHLSKGGEAQSGSDEGQDLALQEEPTVSAKSTDPAPSDVEVTPKGKQFQVNGLAQDPLSHKKGHDHHQHAKFRRAHGFKKNPHATHKHDRLSKLQDAMLGGDHIHIGKVLTSVRSHVDGDTGTSGGVAPAGRRRLTTATDKAKQCMQLVKCAKGMSFYDTMSFFYSDDIDPTTGELDNSILHFSEKNLEAKHDKIKELATDLYQSGGETDFNKYTDTETLRIKSADGSQCLLFSPNPHYPSTWHDVMVRPCTTSFVGGDHRDWRYNPATMQIKSTFGDFCLEVTGSNNVIVNSCGGSSKQRWYMSEGGQLKNLGSSSNLCLEEPAHAGPSMVTCTSSSSQKFTIPTGYDPTKFSSPVVTSIHLWGNRDQCMDVRSSSTKRLIMTKGCNTDPNQQIQYDPVTEELKVGDQCWNYWAGAQKVHLFDCVNASGQKWYRDGNQIKNRHDHKCLQYQGDSLDLTVATCDGSANQQFYAPGMDSPAVSYNDHSFGVIKTKHDSTLCMHHDYIGGSNDLKMYHCWNGASNQKFRYDPVTLQIHTPDHGMCLDYNYNNGNVYVAICHGESNQQWYFDQQGRLKTKRDNKCLEMNLSSNNLAMASTCTNADNQKFFTGPSDMFPEPSTNSKCDDLLQLFHRNVEFEGVPHWEGGTVSQVCLAEGSQTFIKLDQVASKLGSLYAKKTADEIFSCTKDLFNSPARDTSLGELFPFSTVANPTSASQLVIPTGISLDNRNENGMISDIEKPVYTMGSTAHSVISSAVNSAANLYVEFWTAMNSLTGPVYVRADFMDPGSKGHPIGPYTGADTWKNKYHFADKCLQMLQYLVDDKAPPGAYFEFLATLWGVINTKNVADTGFTGDNKAYAKHLQKIHSNAITGTFANMQYGYDLVFGEKTSVGFLCGVKEAVQADGAAKWPGTCCLDAPFQETGDHWGRKHTCPAWVEQKLALSGATVTSDSRYTWVTSNFANVVDGVTAISASTTSPKVTANACSQGSDAMPWVKIDMGSVKKLSAVKLFHYSGPGAEGDGRSHCAQSIKVSQDGSTWETVWDTEKDYGPVETPRGNMVTFPTVEARYIQHHSGGNNVDSELVASILEIEAHGPVWVPGTCSNPGPFFSGIHEESCSANGGTWCAAQTDCSVLDTCIKSELKNAKQNGKAAYASFLEPGLVKNFVSFEECGKSREYFGFDPLYTNDKDICEKVKQLHNTRNFEFLENFFDQGTDAPPVSSDPSNPNPPSGSAVLADIGQHTWLSLNEPKEGEGSKRADVMNGQAWVSTNFALNTVVDAMHDYIEFHIALECPNDPILGNTCKIIKNSTYIIFAIVYVLVKLGLAISQHCYETIVGLNAIQEHTIHEQAAVLSKNMKNINNNLKAVYDDTNTHNENLKLVNTVLGRVEGYFKDGSEVSTIPEVIGAINTRCGPATRRALQLEDGVEVGDMLEFQPEERDALRAKMEGMEAKLGRLEVKLDQQTDKLEGMEKENEALRIKLDQQTEMLRELLSLLAAQES